MSQPERACRNDLSVHDLRADLAEAAVANCRGAVLLYCAAPGRSHVHTLPFAFRAPLEDDESVKMPTTAPSRTSTPCASNDAASIVILLALSEFSEGLALSEFCEGLALSDFAKGVRRLCFMRGEACPPQAGISPAFSVPSAFLCVLCVKSFAFLCAPSPPKPQFLFDTNEPFFRTANFATNTKQSTSFFLFSTNEQLPIPNHYSPITTHQSPISNARSNLSWAITGD